MLRQIITLIFCIWFAGANTIGTIANAQSIGDDFEAPLIEHDEYVSGVLGDVEAFVAAVVDNEELKRVSLFYRYDGDHEFTELIMQPLVDSSYYSATVDTSLRASDVSAIEYYIRAEDEARNVVLKGLSFDPLQRSLVNANAITSSTGTTTIQNSSFIAPPKSKMNWLYVGLGVLLVGSIAAAARSDDDDSNSEPAAGPGCTQNCTVTLTLATP